MADTTILDLWRLADEAVKRRIRIMVEPISGDHFATSASSDTLLHRVTAYTCTCRGFARHGRCTHLALLLVSKGWLTEPDPEPDAPVALRVPVAPVPDPSVAVTCLACLGTGEDDRLGRHSVAAELLVCGGCRGAGAVEAHDDEDRFAPDAWLDERFEFACDEDLAA